METKKAAMVCEKTVIGIHLISEPSWKSQSSSLEYEKEQAVIHARVDECDIWNAESPPKEDYVYFLLFFLEPDIRLVVLWIWNNKQDVLNAAIDTDVKIAAVALPFGKKFFSSDLKSSPDRKEVP